MGRWIGIAVALLLISIGVRSIVQRHAYVPLHWLTEDDMDAEDEGWWTHRWLAVVIGYVEVAIGLWCLRLALHA